MHTQKHTYSFSRKISFCRTAESQNSVTSRSLHIFGISTVCLRLLYCPTMERTGAKGTGNVSFVLKPFYSATLSGRAARWGSMGTTWWMTWWSQPTVVTREWLSGDQVASRTKSLWAWLLNTSSRPESSTASEQSSLTEAKKGALCGEKTSPVTHWECTGLLRVELVLLVLTKEIVPLSSPKTKTSLCWGCQASEVGRKPEVLQSICDAGLGQRVSQSKTLLSSLHERNTESSWGEAATQVTSPEWARYEFCTICWVRSQTLILKNKRS